MVILFFVFIFVYVNEFDHFNLTINAKKLVIPSLLIGGAIGAGIGWYLQRGQREPIVRVQIILACFFAGLIVAPLFASLSNRMLSWKKPQYAEVEFVKEEPYFSSRFGAIKGESQMPSGYYLFFIYKNKLIRVTLDQEYFEGVEEGDFIRIPIKTGLWGIDFIQPNLIGGQEGAET